MRHGLTTGELALFFKDEKQLNLDLWIVRMRGYSPLQKGEFGWPKKRSWVNPSPNAQTLSMARAYPGTGRRSGNNLE